MAVFKPESGEFGPTDTTSGTGRDYGADPTKVPSDPDAAIM